MQSAQLFEEIRVYDGFAERTGAQFDKNTVRRSDGFCRSMTQFLQKARAAGAGTFYLPCGMWPANTEQVSLQKQWVVMSSHPQVRIPDSVPE
jgi:hypothetical protein